MGKKSHGGLGDLKYMGCRCHRRHSKPGMWTLSYAGESGTQVLQWT